MEPLAGDFIESEGEIRKLLPGEEKDFKLSEILLPVPGYDFQMPQNECRHIYQRVLEELKIDDEVFKKPQGEDDIMMSGNFRLALCQPSNLRHLKKMCVVLECVCEFLLMYRAFGLFRNG